MNTNKILPGSLLAGGVLALFRMATVRAVSGKSASKASDFAAIDAYMEDQMRRLRIPGAALAIIEGDQITHLQSFGHAYRGGEAPSPQTPFFIGSLTKSFTALAIMQLVEAGKIELDAPVQRYLPWFTLADADAASQITARHLLNQTSGLSTWSGWAPPEDFGNHPGDIIRQRQGLCSIKLNHPVGAAYEYSNLNFDILGLIIESASGGTYARFIQSNIFDPLNMCHSYTSKEQANRNGLADGHRFWFWSPRAAPDLPLPPAALPSGGLISCAEDLSRYLIALLNDGRHNGVQILSPAGISELHHPAAPVETMGWKAHYGMGWFIEKQDQMKMVWHSGMVPDFCAYMTLLPEQKKGVALLLNIDHFMMNPVITEVGQGVAVRPTGQPSPGPKGLSIASLAPWVMRALLLVPLLQTMGTAAAMRRLRRWDQDPRSRPSRERLWWQHLLLPLIPDLALTALPIYLKATRKLGFLQLYAPDFSWTSILCGAFSGIWAILRTGLILRILRK